jgi:deazaflavin-dependent oxidoreductase (nitroreductase family)
MTDLADLDFCYLTTVGRTSGRPHRIEIWFALHDGTVYLLSGGRERSDWVKNVMASPDVVLEIGDHARRTRARPVDLGTEEDAAARRLLLEKYAGPGRDLAEWGRMSLPITIDWS